MMVITGLETTGCSSTSSRLSPSIQLLGGKSSPFRLVEMALLHLLLSPIGTWVPMLRLCCSREPRLPCKPSGGMVNTRTLLRLDTAWRITRYWIKFFGTENIVRREEAITILETTVRGNGSVEDPYLVEIVVEREKRKHEVNKGGAATKEDEKDKKKNTEETLILKSRTW